MRKIETGKIGTASYFYFWRNKNRKLSLFFLLILANSTCFAGLNWAEDHLNFAASSVGMGMGFCQLSGLSDPASIPWYPSMITTIKKKVITVSFRWNNSRLTNPDVLPSGEYTSDYFLLTSLGFAMPLSNSKIKNIGVFYSLPMIRHFDGNGLSIKEEIHSLSFSIGISKNTAIGLSFYFPRSNNGLYRKYKGSGIMFMVSIAPKAGSYFQCGYTHNISVRDKYPQDDWGKIDPFLVGGGLIPKYETSEYRFNLHILNLSYAFDCNTLSIGGELKQRGFPVIRAAAFNKIHFTVGEAGDSFLLNTFGTGFNWKNFRWDISGVWGDGPKKYLTRNKKQQSIINTLCYFW